MTAEDKLAALGIALPTPAAPVANYLPFVDFRLASRRLRPARFGPDGKIDPAHIGKLGAAVSSRADKRRPAYAPSIFSRRPRRPWAISTRFRAASGSADSSTRRRVLPISQAS